MGQEVVCNNNNVLGNWPHRPEARAGWLAGWLTWLALLCCSLPEHVPLRCGANSLPLLFAVRSYSEAPQVPLSCG